MIIIQVTKCKISLSSTYKGMHVWLACAPCLWGSSRHDSSLECLACLFTTFRSYYWVELAPYMRSVGVQIKQQLRNPPHWCTFFAPAYHKVQTSRMAWNLTFHFFFQSSSEETLMIIHTPTLLHLCSHRCLYQTLGKLKERDIQHRLCWACILSRGLCHTIFMFKQNWDMCSHILIDKMENWDVITLESSFTLSFYILLYTLWE